MTPKLIAPWSDSMSDGCSVPTFLRKIIKTETLEQCLACIAHDRAYYYGGSKKDKLLADLELFANLTAAGMPVWLASLYYIGVRIGGRPFFKVSNVSWAFGGSVFAYTDVPASS